MDELTRFSVLARLIEQEEEPSTSVMPITRTGRMYEQYRSSGVYLCHPGCGKAFRDIASKRAHQVNCLRIQR